MTEALAVVLSIWALAGCGYLVAATFALQRATRTSAAEPAAPEPVSLLVPVAGPHDALAASARAWLSQRHRDELEILFCVLDPDDEDALAVLRDVLEHTPGAPARLVVGDGRSPGPNRKVANLATGLREARFETVVMGDADMLPAPDFLARLLAPLAQRRAALGTALYRAANARGIGGALEALAIEADFVPSVALAAALAPIRFALGGAVATRRATLAAIGGLESLGGYIGEDYHLGRLVAERVGPVALVRGVVPTAVETRSLGVHLRHQLRWARTVRSQRPAGYAGLIVTHPLPPSVLAACLAPGPWTLGLAAAAGAIRCGSVIVGHRLLGGEGLGRRLAVLPLHEGLRLLLWAAGLVGRRVEWRGRRYTLGPEGLIVAAEGDARGRQRLAKARAS